MSSSRFSRGSDTGKVAVFQSSGTAWYTQGSSCSSAFPTSLSDLAPSPVPAPAPVSAPDSGHASLSTPPSLFHLPALEKTCWICLDLHWACGGPGSLQEGKVPPCWQTPPWSCSWWEARIQVNPGVWLVLYYTHDCSASITTTFVHNVCATPLPLDFNIWHCKSIQPKLNKFIFWDPIIHLIVKVLIVNYQTQSIPC